MSDGSDREGSIEAIGSFDDTVEIAPCLATRSGGTTSPTVIFLHGRGQSAALVHELAPAFSPARVIAPPGGIRLRRGRTWFENASIGIARSESVEVAEERFMAWLGRSVPTGCRPWLCGFSNGGAFAGHLLMRHPERFAGAALLSAPLVLPPWKAGALRSKLLFYGRGDRDQVVPSEAFAAAEHYLESASGAALTRRAYPCGHEIGPEEVSDLANWFSAAVS
ncbi:alpha/beta hydrolase [Lichenibacterium ramalinae]|uniref:alpha/beta hydrolase n=1 Tax=Lichenibacterium ramalinae TaxID=2316527 RepID=UPI0013EA2BFB|nr:hypothetical protein [Lichenibacterium ramalinae]